jgi:hypothetical protein
MVETTPKFGAPFIDVDEWRDSPRRHRYVHGGFGETHTRFSFYFPPPELYRGRMFQFLSGGAGGDENSLFQGIDFGFGAAVGAIFDELGGYLVESNQGHFGNEGNTGISGDLELFEASAAAGRYSKLVAKEMYGSAPHHAYVWGGSGGGLRSICCIENRPDVWDGAVPIVIGDAGGSSFPLTLAYWWLYCRHRLADIIDATEPGGSGNPYAGLTDDERRALATLYRGGWNRGAETQLWASASWMFGLAGIKQNDATYFDDFWNKPGYVGHDEPQRLSSIFLERVCTVTRVQCGPDGPGPMWLPAFALGQSVSSDRGDSYGIEVSGDLEGDPDRMYMACATILSGRAKGRRVYVARSDALLIGERMTAPDMFDGVEVGDEIRLDNRDLIAWAHRWMYAIDLERWTVEDSIAGERSLAPEYRGLGMALVDGKPVYPQREGRVLPVSQTGAFSRKVIHVACTHDTIVPLPTVGHYHRMVRAHHGDRIDDYYRLWWVENSAHGAAELLLAWTTPEKNPGVWRSRLVGYGGVICEALRSLVLWVEEGTAPARTTAYRFTSDSGLVLAQSAIERGGVQPVVRAEVNGGLRADVRVGETVTFSGSAQQPPGVGSIVFARWDFDGLGEFTHEHTIERDSPSINVQVTRTYDTPGTYFVSFRVGAYREGLKTQGSPIENGARVRVVVSDKVPSPSPQQKRQ